MASFTVASEVKKLVPEFPPIDFDAPLDASTLKEQSVLITGGAGGIGLACARTTASHGAFVTIADVQREVGEIAAKDVSSGGGNAQIVQCDVTDYG
jgi:5'-hydroxyaverantin dehydrogenase